MLICKEKAVGPRLKGRSCQMSYLSYLESLITDTYQRKVPDRTFHNFSSLKIRLSTFLSYRKAHLVALNIAK